MIPVSRAVCILAFGFILGVTQDYAYAQMGSHKSGDDGARIGGQAGLPYNHMNQSRPSTSAENRPTGESNGRIGGQAGEGYGALN